MFVCPFRSSSVTFSLNCRLKVDSAPGLAIWKLITNKYDIGDRGPAGGIVFYVTTDGLSGLEAAPADTGLVEWGCKNTVITGATRTGIGDGAQNMADIIAACVTLSIAARLADGYSLNGYDGWYLPSQDELDNLNQHKDVVGGFSNIRYWSSTESVGSPIDGAVSQDFSASNTAPILLDDKSDPHGVRVIRAF